MKTITLAKPWTYRTAERTIEFPVGEHVVTNEIAAAADAAGAIPKEEADGGTDSASTPRKARAADQSEG